MSHLFLDFYNGKIIRRKKDKTKKNECKPLDKNIRDSNFNALLLLLLLPLILIILITLHIDVEEILKNGRMHGKFIGFQNRYTGTKKFF